MKQIENILIKIDKLSREEKDKMFSLMNTHYDYVAKVNFYKDLQEKKWAILLRDRNSHELIGFSTYMLLDEIVVDNVRIRAIFSGDTIIDRDHWGCWDLFKAFGKLSFKLHKKYNKDNIKLYWMLISKGYKTYRMLPVFFKKFYPRYDEKFSSFEKKVIDAFAVQKFKTEYNNQTGIIHFSKPHGQLKKGVAEITAEKRKNKHIDFFCKKNPLSKDGDELACIAEFSENNLKSAGLKMVFA